MFFAGALVRLGIALGSRYIEKQLHYDEKPFRPDEPIVRPSHPSGREWTRFAA
jgi:hypothetical protein